MGRGGAERMVSYLLNDFKDDYEIHLILFDNLIEFDLPENQIVEILDPNTKKRRNLVNISRIPLLARKLAKYCNENDISLVFSFLNRPNFVSCLAKKFGIKAKVLISERTHTLSWFPENDIRGKIARLFITNLYSLADAILPNSHGSKMGLINHYGVQSEFHVIKNIVDIERIEKLKKEDCEEIFGGKFSFVMTSNFHEGKNHKMLLGAFAKLENPGIQLLLIGKGVLEEEIKRLAQELEIADKVYFLGQQSNPFKYLSRADCFVFSSDFEGFPNVLVEALACDLPVISTDCTTGPRELLAPDSDLTFALKDSIEIAAHGVLFPVGDTARLAKAMEMIIANDELRQKFRSAAHNRAKDFDSKVVTREIKEILDSYIG
jgi:glycosyltransferase involved in cell wall biosynthesis